MIRRRRGFTLIELLVVIAIIAILAAMLFPVFARARESARKIQCLSNVKNIATAVQMYLTDYDRFPPNNKDKEFLDWLDEQGGGGCIPYGYGRYNGANPYLRWPVILDEYVKNRDVWQCPSVQHVSSAGWIVPQYTPVWWWYLRDNGFGDCGGPCCRSYPPGWGGAVTDSIGQNQLSYDSPGTFTMTIGANNNCLYNRKTAEVDDASNWVVCADNQQGTELNTMFGMAYGNAECCWGLEGDDVDRFYNDASFRSKYAPHLGGLNIGFADGHAAWWQAEAAVLAAGTSVCCGPPNYDSCVQTPGTQFKGMCPFYEVHDNLP